MRGGESFPSAPILAHESLCTSSSNVSYHLNGYILNFQIDCHFNYMYPEVGNLATTCCASGKVMKKSLPNWSSRRTNKFPKVILILFFLSSHINDFMNLHPSFLKLFKLKTKIISIYTVERC